MAARICSFLFVILLYLPVSGQFKKGDRMAGASIATLFFNNTSSDLTVTFIGNSSSITKSYGITLNPSLGWFISEKTALGASLNINPAGQTISYDQGGNTFQKDKNTSFNISFGGFVRNYFSQSGSFLPFGQVNLNGGISSFKTSGFFYGGSGSTAYKQTYSGNATGGFFTNANLAGGLTKMINENTGLEFYIGYSFSYSKNTFNRTTLVDQMNDGTIDETRENETISRHTAHGIQLGAGFQVFLRGKK